jgi:hypothetical protein
MTRKLAEMARHCECKSVFYTTENEIYRIVLYMDEASSSTTFHKNMQDRQETAQKGNDLRSQPWITYEWNDYMQGFKWSLCHCSKAMELYCSKAIIELCISLPAN